MHEEKWQVWTSPAHLLVDTTDPADLVAARTAVQTVLTETDSAINTFDPTSELATINATGAGTYTLSPTLTHILTEAITAYERTSGAFDPPASPPLAAPTATAFTSPPAPTATSSPATRSQ
ncbi:FAD:protein FMN transferase [Rothia nasimurium]|uniref:FAD:protein FMN transferase n=3 Tax=Rothia nasimurium TaxID=85336 RepID=UPI001F421C2E|nr:FAD:protein FMN transferase [Rothia nasimurium]